MSKLPPMIRPTLQDIADRAGFGRATVSMALRNHPEIKPATRELICRTAEEMGYRPNPMIAALMTQLRERGGRTAKGQKNFPEVTAGQIALVSRFRGHIRQREFKDSFYRPLYNAINESAEARGYGIDEFGLGENPVSDARLTQILRARGIRGVLFFPGADSPRGEFPDLDWRYFATVLIGFNTAHEGLHQVCSDYGYDFECALRHVRAAGFRRIGLAVTNRVDTATNHAWGSRYLFYRHGIPARDRLPPLFSARDHLAQEEVCAWYERHRPQVVLSAGEMTRDILVRAGHRVPEDVRVVNLVQRGEPGLAGIDPHTAEVGHAAVDLLASLLHGNHLGQPTFPRRISIRGHWVAGASFPE